MTRPDEIGPDDERLLGRFHERYAAIESDIPPAPQWTPPGSTRAEPTAAPGRGASLVVIASAVVVIAFALGAGRLLPSSEDGDAGERSSVPATTASLDGFVTEPVEPGVVRVLNDGVRDLTATLASDDTFDVAHIVAGRDGSVWRVGGGEIIRLGGPAFDARPEEELPRYTPEEEFEVDRDGRLWRAVLQYRPSSFGPGRSLWSFDGDSWSRHAPDEGPSSGVFGFATTDAGGRYLYSPLGVQRIDEAGPVLVSPLEDHGERPDIGADVGRHVQMRVTADGTRWLLVGGRPAFYRDAGSGWERIPVDDLIAQLPEGSFADDERSAATDVAADGTIWVVFTERDDAGARHRLSHVARFQGGSWEVWREGDDAPVFVGEGAFTGVHASPDGSVWVWPRRLDQGAPPCAPIARFDGAGWTGYLADRCVIDLDVAPDGSAWAVAAASLDIAEDPVSVYAITPDRS